MSYISNVTITNEDEHVNSSDVIARIEYLVGLEEAYAEEGETLDSSDTEELRSLQALAQEGESAPDWNYGLTLIRETSLTDRVKEDYQETSEGINWNASPFNCIDWDEVADEERSDFTEIDWDGVTYYYR